MRFRPLWCTFTRFNLLFRPFMRFRNIVANPCFIRRHKLTQKLFRIAQSFFMYKCVCKILTTRSVEMDTISAISRTFTFGSFKTISCILLIFFRVVAFFGRPGLGMVLCVHTTSTKFGTPLSNHSIRRSRIRIILIEFGLFFNFAKDLEVGCFQTLKLVN